MKNFANVFLGYSVLILAGCSSRIEGASHLNSLQHAQSFCTLCVRPETAREFCQTVGANRVCLVDDQGKAQSAYCAALGGGEAVACKLGPVMSGLQCHASSESRPRAEYTMAYCDN